MPFTKHFTSIARVILPVLLLGTQPPVEAGIIGKLKEDGLPVVYALEPVLPATRIMNKHPWLTTVTWRYDKSQNNGMPESPLNRRMIALEELLAEPFAAQAEAIWVYNRTGNGLKTFAFYVKDRDAFMTKFNGALRGNKPFPIEITFYSDPQWTDFNELVDIFSK